MVSYAVALVLGVLFVSVVYVYLSVAEKILRSNSTEAAEAKAMLGGFRKFLMGQLAHNPSSAGDYRATQGLAFDKKKRKIRMQSTLSTEKYRAVFNR